MTDLSNYIGQINAEHEAATNKAREAVTHAFQCGRYLLEVKDILGHGRFLPWVRENVTFSERTAQRYMRLADKTDTVTDYTSVRSALAAFETARPPTSDDEPLPLELEPPPGCGRMADMPNDGELWLMPSTTDGHFYVAAIFNHAAGCMVHSWTVPFPPEYIDLALISACPAHWLDEIHSQRVEWRDFEVESHSSNLWLGGSRRVAS